MPLPPAGRDRHLPPGTGRVLHVDVDAFLASVEQALFPHLRGRPVVVGGLPHERNVIQSCSYEARHQGLRPGMPLAEARRRCPNAIFRRGDSQAANHLRERLARLLLEYSPRVEIASIDDLLVDLAGTTRLFGDAFDVALDVQRRARAELHLPLTVGVGRSVFFARLAGKLAKPGAVAELLPGREQALLDALPLEHLSGVGHTTAGLLARFGLSRVGELRRVATRELLYTSFGRLGLELFERAHGRDPRVVEPNVRLGEDGGLHLAPPRSLQREATFEPEEGRPELLEAMLAWLVERLSHRLRAFGLAARTIEVRVRYVDTRRAADGSLEPGEREAGNRASNDTASNDTASNDTASDERSAGRLAQRRRLENPSHSSQALFRAARELYRALPRRRALVKTLGVRCDDLVPAAGQQRALFDGDTGLAAPAAGTREERHARLDRVLDALRARHGFGRALRASTLPLAQTHPLGPDGFRLRTPSLNQ
jgi:DNA polymerase IV